MWQLILAISIVMALMIALVMFLIGWIFRQQKQIVQNSQISIGLVQELAGKQIQEQNKSFTEATQQITEMTTNLILGRQMKVNSEQEKPNQPENGKDLLGVELTALDYLANLPEEMRLAILRDGLQNRTKNPLMKPYADGQVHKNGTMPEMTPAYEAKLMEEMSPFRRIPEN